jgi:hypothetical protein
MLQSRNCGSLDSVAELSTELLGWANSSTHSGLPRTLSTQIAACGRRADFSFVPALAQSRTLDPGCAGGDHAAVSLDTQPAGGAGGAFWGA